MNHGTPAAAPEPQFNKPVAPPAPPQEQISANYGAGAKVAPKAAEPPAMTEKQRMAAALFGGMGAAALAPAASPKPPQPAHRPVPVSTPQPPAPPPAAKPPAGGDDLLDLLDMGGGGGGAVSTPAPTPAKAAGGSSSGADDLMLLDLGDSSSPPMATPPAAPAPLLAPLPCSTAQVGQSWGTLPSERRVQFVTSCSTPQDMMMRLQSQMNVHPVEIIGMEGIAAGRVLPGNEPCFLHGKLAPPRLDLLVRCRDPAVAQRVAEMSQRALS